MKLKIKIDDSRFRRALRSYSEHSRKSGAVLLRQQSRLFVRDVVRITPPNQGTLSKSRGEATIRADIARIVKVSRKASAEEAEAVHTRRRTRNGRVDRRVKPVPAKNIPALRQKLLSRVGMLASGWNAAAAALGLTMSPWIARHGSKYGSINISLGFTRLTITIRNRVPFVTNVSNMTRRIQSALDNRATQMWKQVDDFLARDARKAGFR